MGLHEKWQQSGVRRHKRIIEALPALKFQPRHKPKNKWMEKLPWKEAEKKTSSLY